MDFYRHCEDLVRASDKDRFLATLFAPADKRGPLFALYAFNAEIAGVRDRVREPMAGEIRLQWWRDVLNGERASEAAANPVAAALLDTIARCALPAEPLRDLIEAHAFDLYDDPMPTQTALDAYGRKTAAVVFGEAARICGATRAVEEAAEHAGMAYAITDRLRRFARDASRGQVFVPAELLERHGTRVEDGDGRAGERRAVGAALAALRGARGGISWCSSCCCRNCRKPRCRHSCRSRWCPVISVRWSGTTTTRSTRPVEVAQWRRQWVLWRAARRYAGTMRGS